MLRGDIELAVNAVRMGSGGMDRDEQFLADVFAVPSFGEEEEHFPLARSEGGVQRDVEAGLPPCADASPVVVGAILLVERAGPRQLIESERSDGNGEGEQDDEG